MFKVNMSWLRALAPIAVYLLLPLTANAQTQNCEYIVSNEWNTGLTSTVRITNNTDTTINGWSVNWSFETNQLAGSWNADISGNNPFTAQDVGWNATIQPGESVEFGLQVDKNGGNAETPTLSGTVCSSDGDTDPDQGDSSDGSGNNGGTNESGFGDSDPTTAQQCNWFGTNYPLCEQTQTGWGWENNQSCIAPSTCSDQPAPYGIINAGGDSNNGDSGDDGSGDAGGGDETSGDDGSSNDGSSGGDGNDDQNNDGGSDSAINFERLRNLTDIPVGVAVPAGNDTNSIMIDNQVGNSQQEVIEQHFSQITAENIMKPESLHPQQGNFNFTQADALVDYALSNNIGVHGHVLVWHNQAPGWMQNFQGTEEEWVQMIRDHVTGIASHYAGQVESWDVVNEAFVDSGLRDTFLSQAMGDRFLEEAFLAAREAAPDADLYYNDFNMENNQPRLDHALAMVDDFQQRDIPIDGIGFQFHVFMDWPSVSNMRQAFSRVVDRGLKVKITELDIPLNNPFSDSYDFPNNFIDTFTPELAQEQRVRFCQIVEAYVDEVPPELRGGVSVWGVFDSHSWLIETLFDNNHDDWPLLFNDNFEPKPAMQGVADALTGMPCQ